MLHDKLPITKHYCMHFRQFLHYCYVHLHYIASSSQDVSNSYKNAALKDIAR